MIFEALEPLYITTKSLGEVSLSPGDRLDWPDQAVKMLLAQYPESVRVVKALPFRVGETVSYRVPVITKAPSQYTWSEHYGTVQAVDSRWEMVTVIPSDEAEPWRIVPWVYAKKVSDAQE